MQIDQGVGVPGAVRGLVQAHGPAAHPLAGLADPLRCPADVALGESGDLGDPVGRIVREEGGHLLPAVGEVGDELLVGVPVRDQQMQQTVEQGEVGAGLDLQEEVGLVRGGVAAGVDDYQLGAGRLHPVHHAQEEDRVAVGHVGADDEERVRAVEVLVRAGRAVRAQRQLVAGSRGGHAQAGVRLDPVRPDEPLGQFVRQVLRLQGHLPGHVEGQRVGPVLVQDRPQAARDCRDGLVHVGLGRLVAPFGAHQRLAHAPGRGHHVRARRPLGAQPAEVGGVGLVPGSLRGPAPAVDGVPGHVEHDPAADAAVRTDRADPAVRRASCHPNSTLRCVLLLSRAAPSAAAAQDSTVGRSNFGPVTCRECLGLRPAHAAQRSGVRRSGRCERSCPAPPDADGTGPCRCAAPYRRCEPKSCRVCSVCCLIPS